jgi:hypothetical protein
MPRVVGNLKTTLSGAFHALRYRKYGQIYLTAFAYRFNRRFDLRGLAGPHRGYGAYQASAGKSGQVGAC